MGARCCPILSSAGQLAIRDRPPSACLPTGSSNPAWQSSTALRRQRKSSFGKQNTVWIKCLRSCLSLYHALNLVYNVTEKCTDDLFCPLFVQVLIFLFFCFCSCCLFVGGGTVFIKQHFVPLRMHFCSLQILYHMSFWVVLISFLLSFVWSTSPHQLYKRAMTIAWPTGINSWFCGHYLCDLVAKYTSCFTLVVY